MRRRVPSRAQTENGTPLPQISAGLIFSCYINSMEDVPLPLAGKLVLLIEEDTFLAGSVRDGIAGAGGQIVGPARTIEEAEGLAARMRHPPFAVVASTSLFDADGGRLNGAVQSLRAPVLLLQKEVRAAPVERGPHDTLVAPFAAYQVVDHLRRLADAPAVAR